MQNWNERLAALAPERRALLEARLRDKGLAAPPVSGIRPIPNRDRLPYFPASLDQERLWFVDQMEPGNPAYNIHNSTRMIGPMDPELMRRAIETVVGRHEVLRTIFRVVDGRPVQVVVPHVEIELPVVDLQHVPAGERQAAAHRAAVEAASVRFDLERGPLVRARLARLGPEDHVLMICMQHAITDRWSFDIFEREVAQVYVALRDGREAVLPELPIQFADFAAWQREELSGERLERHLDYWRRKLSGAPMVLEMPSARPRPPVQTFAGARAYTVYSEALLGTLKGITHAAGATMFMTTLAALATLCWKYTGQRDLLIGSAIADRNRPETENVIGYFLNMLLLRGTIDPEMTFRQLLQQVRETALGAYAHQDVPFATLVSELRPRQDPSRNPLIQVSFIYLDFPITATPEEAGFSANSLDIDNGASRFDMTLACTELPGLGLHSYIEYNTDLYDAPMIERMLRHLGRILEAVAADPDFRLGDLDVLEPAERERLVVRFNDTARPYETSTLHELVLRAAAERPEAAALVYEARTTTFAELEASSERIASRLRGLGVGPGALVPVCAARSPAQAAALLGVLRAGAGYVPIDPALPAPRLASMLIDVRSPVVLAERALASAVPLAGATLVEIETVLEEDIAGKLPAASQDVPADGPAYVMFTSGSTGVPKGVRVSHRAIVNRLQWAQEEYPLSPADRVLHQSSYGFDIAVWELFGSLLAGATVVLANDSEQKDPAAQVRLVREQRVTVAHFVPSMLRACLAEPELARCATLRAVFCGGEGLDRELHDRFFERLPGRTLVHFYGPTEAAISCLFHRCSPNLAPGPVPIGRPIANMRISVLDETLHPVPAGVPGEIAIGGVGLADGYLARPDLTAERFVPDPVSEVRGARLYRTGDRARFRDDGTIEFLGRTDHQIKLRGYRIEPGEIETVLESLPGVERAIAGARGEGPGRRLVAWVVAPNEPPDEAAMRAALRQKLPEFMVPAAFVLLRELPLGPNGKVDRASLPEPGVAGPVPGVPPRTPTEEAIAGIWAELLRRESVGVLDSFFDLGGDSLLATQVVSRVRAAFAIDLPLRRFFEGSTVAALGGIVDDLLLEKLESMPEEEAAQLLESAREAMPEG